MFHLRAMTLLACVTGLLPAQQAASITVKIIHLNPVAVQVRQQGRVLGSTPGEFAFAPGVQRLQIGQTDHCLYVGEARTAEVVLSAGKIEGIVGALKCEDAWSDVIVLAVPSLVTALGSSGETPTRMGRDAVLRIPLPSRVTVNIAGPGYAPFSTEVVVGPHETLSYRARLGPMMPALVRDTILQALPPEPTVPQPPSVRTEPVDPSARLVDADSRLAIMRSRSGAEVAGHIGTWTFIGGAVASIVYGILWAQDSLHTKPYLGRNLGISLGVTGLGWLIEAPAYRSAKRKASSVGCSEVKLPSHRRNCQRGIEGEVSQLRAEQSSFPARRSAWQVERTTADAAYRAAQAEYSIRRQAWVRTTADLTARNATATRNRQENQRTLDAWRMRARAAQGLDLVSRTRRP